MNKKQSAYHSLLHSSVHDSDVSDPLSEGRISIIIISFCYPLILDSAVLALQLKRDANTKSFGGINVMKGFGEEVGDKEDEFNGFLPLPSSPPHPPQYTESHASSTSAKQKKLV